MAATSCCSVHLGMGFRVLFAVCASAWLAPAGAVRAADEPFQLEARLGYQIDRLHSTVADSLGLSMTSATVVAGHYDFRIFRVPMAGADKPAFHLTGDVLLGRRALPVRELAGAGFAGAPIEEVPVAEIVGGFLVRVPMTLVDASAGSALHLGYRGGLVLGGGAAPNDFPKVKQFVFGFSRTRGFLEGSTVEMAYGTNEAASREFGAHRWEARVLLVAQVHARPAPPAAKPVAGRAPAPAARAMAWPVRLFAELDVDTDGSVGPDLLTARGGVVFDAGRVLSRLLGSKN